MQVNFIPGQFKPGQFASTLDDSPQTQLIGYISFDWKELANSFFREENFVRHQRALLRGPYYTRACLDELVADADKLLVEQLVQCGVHAGAKKEHWISYEVLDGSKTQFIQRIREDFTARAHYDPLYISAYKRRLRKSFAAVGLRTGHMVADAELNIGNARRLNCTLSG